MFELSRLPVPLIAIFLCAPDHASPIADASEMLQCPAATKAMKTPTQVYCVCIGTICLGSACKAAKHAGSIMHGYPNDCKDCRCASRREMAERAASAINAAKPAEDGLRIIYIKSYKVASTTVASIFQRLSEERGLKAATRYNAGMPMNELGKGTYQMVYGHNFYDAGTKAGYPCQVRRKSDQTWTQCGGYQLWMDHYVQNATHLIMIAEPLERIASMYYYEAGYTKQKDRGPDDQEYTRINNEARFEDPVGVDNDHIAKFLTEQEFYAKWERVQWWWIRDMTENRVVAEAIQLLSDQFTIGLTSKLDESLMLWKAKLRLFTRDIIYTSMKSSLSHPKFSSWSDQNKQTAENLVSENGDSSYFAAAAELFKKQVEIYGAERLEEDVAQFRALISKLQSVCRDVAVPNEMLHVPDQVYCMLKHYDRAYERIHQQQSFVGCYKSLEGPTLRYSQKLFSSEMTLTACSRRCTMADSSRNPFSYFAVAFGTHCYCGYELPSKSNQIEPTECSLPCTGNPDVNCGGQMNNALHSIEKRDKMWSDSILSAAEIISPEATYTA